LSGVARQRAPASDGPAVTTVVTAGLRKYWLSGTRSQVVRQRSAKSLHLSGSCPAISQQLVPRRRSEAARSRRVARACSDPATSTKKIPTASVEPSEAARGTPNRIVAGDVAGVSDQ